MRQTKRSRWFTLPEVLVTITITAVLAAVVVPAVLNQVSKGDTAGLAGDTGALRTAISSFTTVPWPSKNTANTSHCNRRPRTPRRCGR